MDQPVIHPQIICDRIAIKGELADFQGQPKLADTDIAKSLMLNPA